MTQVNAFGITPERRQIVLTEGADFGFKLRKMDGTNWSGDAFSIVLGNGTTWTATVSGVDASFAVDKAATTAALVPAGTTYKLFHTNGTLDECWYLGTVVRKDA